MHGPSQTNSPNASPVPYVQLLVLLLQIEWVIFSVFCQIYTRIVAPHCREVEGEDAKHSLSIDGMLALFAWAARAVNPEARRVTPEA
jgi:hypothetical protein